MNSFENDNALQNFLYLQLLTQDGLISIFSTAYWDYWTILFSVTAYIIYFLCASFF